MDVIRCQWPPADVRDMSSVVYLSDIRCSGLLITRHPLLRQAHHRLIRPGCMSLTSRAQLGSVLRIQSHWLQRCTVCNVSFMVWRRTCPWIPRSLGNLMLDAARKPLQPISTGQSVALQPRYSVSNAMSAYRGFFLIILPGFCQFYEVCCSCQVVTPNDLTHSA